jgi:DNA polymerase-3 subunit gamma/tau
VQRAEAPRATQAAEPRTKETQPAAAAEPAPGLRSFADVVARARAERDRLLVFELERHIRPVRFEPGHIEIALTPDAKPDLPQRLGLILKGWTGMRWIVVVSQDVAAETVHETRRRDRAAVLDEVRSDPLVAEVLERFPGAEIVDVRERAAPAMAPEPALNDDLDPEVFTGEVKADD